MEMMSWR